MSYHRFRHEPISIICGCALYISTNGLSTSKRYTLYDKDPTHYSRPRTVRTGLEFNF